MGQLFSNLWKWVCPETRKETQRIHNHNQTANYKTFYDETHFNKVLDDHHHHHHQSIIVSDSSSRGILGILDDNYLDLNRGNEDDGVHIVVVDLNRANNEEDDDDDAKKEVENDENEKTLIKFDYYCNNNNNYNGNLDQVLEKYVTNEEVVNNVRRLGPYCSDQRILLVGEGDFSFSACLAVAFGTSSTTTRPLQIVATSLNTQEFLKKNYGNFIKNKAELESRGSMVLHGVNATKMLKHHVIGSMVFDRIIFNFPHVGKFGHTDTDLRANQKLIRGFLKNAKKMIGEDGEIHIRSKSNKFYQDWNIPKIGRNQGLKLIGEITFKRRMFPGYNTKYGFGGDKDFDCNPSKTYKFCLSLK